LGSVSTTRCDPNCWSGLDSAVNNLLHAFGADDDGNVWHQAQTTPTAWP
jgi:hypothetical protein